MSENPLLLSVRSLLSGNKNNEEYLIPFYQRNYAWEEGEITQLIQDVIDSLRNERTPEARNYYIGTLVVHQRPNTPTPVFETIDGQQRLTTLLLLASYLNNNNKVNLAWPSTPCIKFEGREHSRTTLEAIFRNKFDGIHAEGVDKKKINYGIITGYELIDKVLHNKKKNGLDIQKFADFLLDCVQILRVQVPEDTNLNHYFEIMNSRGEQLEKHEVLKARMMELLNDTNNKEMSKRDQHCLHTVWEACANMERYVQMGFIPSQRSAIFGAENWGCLPEQNFGSLRDACTIQSDVEMSDKSPPTFLHWIENAPPHKNSKEPSEEMPERFNKIIDFPNFLLHVLSVSTDPPKNFSLNDKFLLEMFEVHFKDDKKDTLAVADKVKNFVVNLLRCKYLLDHCVIKRDFVAGKGNWSLKRLKWDKGGGVSY